MGYTRGRRIRALIGICLGVAVGAIFFSAVNTALAAIQTSLDATLTQLQWVMNIFGITICSTLVTVGRLADIYGRKRIYLIGICLLAVSMLGSGLAPQVEWIIFFQAILGFSSAILIPVSQALISNLYSAEERSKAMGIWAAVVGLAMAVGPLYSGAMISWLSWRWVFLGTLPLIAISLILVALFSQESHSEEQESHIDYVGILLLFITISTFVLAVVQGQSWRASLVTTLYIVSVVAFVLLLYFEKKVIQPIIRGDLFKNRQFLTASIANLCLIFFVWASFFFMPLYFQTIRHYSPLQTGLMMLNVTIPLTIFSFTVGHLYRRWGAKWLIGSGFVFLLLSAVLQMYFQPNSNVWLLLMGTLAFGVAWGFIWTPSTTAAISVLSLQDAGIASGTFITLQEIGGTVGLAITGAVVRAHTNLLVGYHDGMWVLVVICLIGMMAAGLMQSTKSD
ncbi:MAG: hypothetical protein A3F41_03380 [Coxiella sp. RIFCSPHIGHO2_12_FULL_44_14]|nr:MAG: hypothetical protein A3F41_03380 [Coxiella sp. RIFCSPHIGHO2_12_FULL_44_14]